jgi:1-acyl-sn-glycerol-3-phosphate acyltransferase
MMWFIGKVCRFIAFITGWKHVDECSAGVDKAVMIMIGHTSNWDFLRGLGAFDSFGRPVRFTIKKEWLKFPFGFFFNALGAFGVDRSKSTSATTQMAQALKKFERGFFVVTPEGTRSKRDKWKTGFYYVALEAKVPIILSYVDYAKKRTGLKKLLYPSGDYKKDLKEIVEFYSTITPKYPEKFALDMSFNDSTDESSPSQESSSAQECADK